VGKISYVREIFCKICDYGNDHKTASPSVRLLAAMLFFTLNLCTNISDACELFCLSAKITSHGHSLFFFVNDIAFPLLFYVLYGTSTIKLAMYMLMFFYTKKSTP